MSEQTEPGEVSVDVAFDELAESDWEQAHASPRFWPAAARPRADPHPAPQPTCTLACLPSARTRAARTFASAPPPTTTTTPHDAQEFDPNLESQAGEDEMAHATKCAEGARRMKAGFRGATASGSTALDQQVRSICSRPAGGAIDNGVPAVMSAVRKETHRAGQPGASPALTPLPSLSPTRPPDVVRVRTALSGLPPGSAARDTGLDVLAGELRSASEYQLAELVAGLRETADKALLLNIGRLQLRVDAGCGASLDTALALLKECCFFDSPTMAMLDNLTSDEYRAEEDQLGRMIELLCASTPAERVPWEAGRLELGELVAHADVRYKGLWKRDYNVLQDADEASHQAYEGGLTRAPAEDLADLDPGSTRPYLAASVAYWRKARGVFDALSVTDPSTEDEPMPEDEQVLPRPPPVVQLGCTPSAMYV